MAAAGETNVDLNLAAKGTGEIIQTASSTTQRNGNFLTAGDAQAVNYVLRGATNGTTPTEIFIDGIGAGDLRMVLSTDSTWSFRALVVARKNDANDSAGYSISGCIDNNATTVDLVGTTTVEDWVKEDSAGWAVAFSADNTNKSLKCEVTGPAAGPSVNWVAYVQTVQVTVPDVY